MNVSTQTAAPTSATSRSALASVWKILKNFTKPTASVWLKVRALVNYELTSMNIVHRISLNGVDTIWTPPANISGDATLLDRALELEASLSEATVKCDITLHSVQGTHHLRSLFNNYVALLYLLMLKPSWNNLIIPIIRYIFLNATVVAFTLSDELFLCGLQERPLGYLIPTGDIGKSPRSTEPGQNISHWNLQFKMLYLQSHYDISLWVLTATHCHFRRTARPVILLRWASMIAFSQQKKTAWWLWRNQLPKRSKIHINSALIALCSANKHYSCSSSHLFDIKWPILLMQIWWKRTQREENVVVYGRSHCTKATEPDGASPLQMQHHFI